jgi:hypothetical protein
MRTGIAAAAALAAMALAAGQARAQAGPVDVSGAWRVAGKVSSFAFTLTCDFKPDGARLGGVCVDGSTSDPKVATGKAHRLTAGRIDGDKVSWTYQSSFLLTKFDVSYSGTMTGGRISGTIDAQGRQGAFTATRP